MDASTRRPAPVAQLPPDFVVSDVIELDALTLVVEHREPGGAGLALWVEGQPKVFAPGCVPRAVHAWSNASETGALLLVERSDAGDTGELWYVGHDGRVSRRVKLAGAPGPDAGFVDGSDGSFFRWNGGMFSVGPNGPARVPVRCSPRVGVVSGEGRLFMWAPGAGTIGGYDPSRRARLWVVEAPRGFSPTALLWLREGELLVAFRASANDPRTRIQVLGTRTGELLDDAVVPIRLESVRRLGPRHALCVRDREQQGSLLDLATFETCFAYLAWIPGSLSVCAPAFLYWRAGAVQLKSVTAPDEQPLFTAPAPPDDGLRRWFLTRRHALSWVGSEVLAVETPTPPPDLDVLSEHRVDPRRAYVEILGAHQLREDVVLLLTLLGARDYEAALTAIQRDSFLARALEPREIARVRSAGGTTALMEAIRAGRQGTSEEEYSRCRNCGRHTLHGDHGWTHGNPATSASDTEYGRTDSCRSCGHSRSFP